MVTFERINKEYKLPNQPAKIWEFFWCIMLHGAAADSL